MAGMTALMNAHRNEALEAIGGAKEEETKKVKQKINSTAFFRLRQIWESYRGPRGKSAFAQNVNRTKMFHVKLFGTIDEFSEFCLGRGGECGLKAAPDCFLGANQFWLWCRRIMLIALPETRYR
jgi:hypothetical protein